MQASSAAAAPQNTSNAIGMSEGRPWPREVELLSPTQKQQLLNEYYVEDKSHWEPWYTSPDDAWRRLNLGFIDPTARPDHIDLEDPANAYLRPPDWDPNEGPLTVQELEKTLEKLVKAGTKATVGRDVASVLDLTYAERQMLLKRHYENDPRWGIGVVDPKAGPDAVSISLDLYGSQPFGWDENTSPLTVQELEATLDKLVKLGTKRTIGRDVRSANELTYGEQQTILKDYYRDDPRWQFGVIDPTVPLDSIEIGGERSDLQPPSWQAETPLTIQEVEETLKKMLEKKLRTQESPNTAPR